MVRAKFRVVSVSQDIYQSAARTIKLAPHYDDAIPEDQRFAQATPSGELIMYVNNPRAVAELELGKYFYLDFVAVEE